MRILPSGDAAVIVADVGDASGPLAALAARPPRGVVDLVPAPRTLMLVLDPSAVDAEEAVAAVRGVRLPAPPAGAVRVPVVYDGADLRDVADLTGLTPGQVIEARTGTPWTVAFDGSAPGFGYLTGGDPRLRVPRRGASRRRVPAGAVGPAGPFSGVCPMEAPGGRLLIGRTDPSLLPGALRPGVQVHFTRRHP
ncbi:allophanate hydrolase [Actinomadura rubrobrunea]|uniref:Allophanate hydrolase n=1 Tax=Actinomadura rubrobrunea TaxID=115335 RepID=A0A9W6PUL1_9ACTN|nr:carboxyltransferase domain-containing protein [Actinomadura rubrobrunea]GLW64065.1 allophanate hydrolase [Actinomadura rubrobrunea]